MIYLGQSVPLRDVKSACETHNPQYVFTMLTTNLSANFQGFLNKMSRQLADYQILSSGYLLKEAQYELPSNLTLLEKTSDVLQYSSKR